MLLPCVLFKSRISPISWYDEAKENGQLSEIKPLNEIKLDPKPTYDSLERQLKEHHYEVWTPDNPKRKYTIAQIFFFSLGASVFIIYAAAGSSVVANGPIGLWGTFYTISASAALIGIAIASACGARKAFLSQTLSKSALKAYFDKVEENMRNDVKSLKNTTFRFKNTTFQRLDVAEFIEKLLPPLTA